jgi:hypothetical protein
VQKDTAVEVNDAAPESRTVKKDVALPVYDEEWFY